MFHLSRCFQVSSARRGFPGLAAALAGFLLFLLLVPLSSAASGGGNVWNDSFNRAKKTLEKRVYFDHRITLYCGATFDELKRITLPEGFRTATHAARSRKMEWEHVVPAENFGRIFPEWREGGPACVDNRGRAFKGRHCAEKTNALYRFMQSDMYNLYPSVGSVNAARQNFNFRRLSPDRPSSFGTCEMKIEGDKVEPPARARGAVARTYKYMQAAYPGYRMSRQQQQLMDAWDERFPVDAWECLRAARIEAIQGNENPYVKEPCMAAGLWP